ncbi:MmcB family DNA repair protein [Anderseniella sp. Alg231-50]|uniref:MmcB family DNA repair protein n=1 Tax=Anderseniella sp. Alg231-50 TaxID=1922226 RepID=UPI00307BFBAE
MSDPVVNPDGRQSATAAAVQRGTGRMLLSAGFASISEVSLANGRRADLIAVNAKGEIWIVEIKSSPADYLSDHKWHDYMAYCDRFYFAIPPDMDRGLVDEAAGLMIADAWGAEIVREASEARLSGARRKAVTLLLARSASMRLQSTIDPNANGL